VGFLLGSGVSANYTTDFESSLIESPHIDAHEQHKCSGTEDASTSTTFARRHLIWDFISLESLLGGLSSVAVAFVSNIIRSTTT
jgi:hypothetical protein